MGKKLEHTPDGIIRSALRRLFMTCREKHKTLKEAGYRCSKCGVKQSTAKGREVKVEVHHRSGIEWKPLIAEVRRMLLNQLDMCVLCKDCHKEEHSK
jgi:predicted HNH restriction endonuclease